VEQLPTITSYSPGRVIALPFDKTVKIECDARGNPPPQYRWTKDGEDFVPPRATTTKTQHTDGSFVLHNKQFIQFQGTYRCYAFNKLGTAMTKEITLIVPTVPKFPKVGEPPIAVDEGDPITLHCHPPEGAVPRQLYWMSLDLQLIQQDERVSMGTDGNLYFSHALQNDSRLDYYCNAAFPKLRTIVQKMPMAVTVRSLKWMKMGEKLPPRTEFDNFGRLLILSEVEESDGGQYMCKAKNSAGEAVHYFNVMVEGAPPEWLTGPPQDQLLVIGSDVHIKCSVSGKPSSDIIWRKNGELFIDDPENNRRVLDDTVVLHNAGPEDTAVYQCDASNGHGGLLANINIMVMSESQGSLLDMTPRILTSDSQEYPVVQGVDVIMNCSAFSSPLPTISWFRGANQEAVKGERFFTLQNGSLQIIGAEKNDSGKYVCVALNTEGKAAVTAVLDVKDPTRIVSGPRDAEVMSGATAQLICQAEYDKSLQDSFVLVWRKDGDDIPLSVEENSRYAVADSMLRIMNVALNDSGTYMCIARTSLDEMNATALLTVLDVPDAPLKVEISEIRSPRNISLSWVPGSDHNSSVTEFVVEFQESQWESGVWKKLQKVPGNQATADLVLHGDLSYKFRVYAINAVGPGPPGDPTETHKTPPAAPDRNPQDIKIQGHLPHQMDISWESLPVTEQNGPGFEYKVSYRRLGVEDQWREHMVKQSSFVVRNTSTFVPYEVKIQSRNDIGWGPEPKVVTGYSGEDVPAAAPRDVAVEVFNTTVLRVSWTPVPPATVRGHLGGYKLHWSRLRSLLNPNRTLDQRQSLSFPGRRAQAMVPGLEPFSEYRLTVSVYNKKGNGPNSDPVTFSTPEGDDDGDIFIVVIVIVTVPAQVPILTAYNTQKKSVFLEWSPPLPTNGILIGYLLQYHLINTTTMEVADSREVNISVADATQWQIRGLEEGSLYRFLLSGCTRVGCGPPLAQESHTITQERHNCSLFFPSSVPGNPTLPPPLGLALLNISSYVSDTFARISWNAGDSQQDSQFYVAYMNNRVESQKSGFSMLSAIIGTMCAIVLLVLIALMACFVRRNIGGKYAVSSGSFGIIRWEPHHVAKNKTKQKNSSTSSAVKGKEDLHPDVESQEMNDDTFCEYSDSEEKPLKGGSSRSLHGDDTAGDRVSRDSLVEYADGGGEFSEDGSFIGEYSGRKHAGSVSEPSEAGTVTA
ncbi:unnamed protein product, partial [Tetraodon nigroviridis]